MHRHTQILLLIIITIASFSFTYDNANFAFACSCGQTSMQERFERSEAVFSGRAIETEIIQPNMFTMKTTFQVDRAWRGLSENTVTVRTSTQGSACGYFFEEGKSYLVYAFGDEHPLSTSSCGGAMPIETAAGHLVFLGQGYIPSGGPGDLVIVDNSIGPLPAIFGIGAAVAAVITFLTLRRGRQQ
ncbi:MAG TPA: hypothetical protein VFS46_08205 [Nitrososphaera sp.]|nr:hypothetical protein [Nitrososphaera sp.]